MAQSFQTTQGTLYTPGAVTSITVGIGGSGTTATGVIALIGEADAGAPYTVEVAGNGLANNVFGPGQLSQVVAKYKTGPIVDAFRLLTNPSKDPQIQGAPSAIIIVKTNGASSALGSTGAIQATLPIADLNSANYGTLLDPAYGTLGNLIYVSIVAATSEVLPTSAPFTFIPPNGTLALSMRANGGTALAVTTSGVTTPDVFVTDITGAGGYGSCGFTAAGGVDRLSVSGAMVGVDTLALAVNSPDNVTITLSVSWAHQPAVGDTLSIDTTSVLASVHSTNAGGYVVTASTPTTVTAVKIKNFFGVGGSLHAPVAQTALTVGSATLDVQFFSPVTIAVHSGIPIDGLGKSLEIADLGTGTDSGGLASVALQLSATPVTWVSTLLDPQVIASASEYSITQKDNRQVDNRSETISAGGQIALSIGYTGITASITFGLVNSVLSVSSAVTGGSGGALPTMPVSAFPTIASFVTWVNTQTGWTAAIPVGSGTIGFQPLSSIDQATYACCADWAAMPARIKTDAYDYAQALSADATLVALQAPATAGLPASIVGNVFLGASGGVQASRGGTLEADFSGAVDALKLCTCNFVVPLFSRDAVLGTSSTSTPTADVPNGTTEFDSTYVLASMHAYVLTHCLTMAQLKRKRNRQGFLSIRSTFQQAKNAATALNNGRVSMCFQDVKSLDSFGNIVQFQPWMAAVCAAGMQAAGFYRLIVTRQANISGAVQYAGDFSDQDPDAVDSALESGLLPLRLDDTWVWVSDQTTYAQDNNFYYNSIQAVYVGDVIALTLSASSQKAFVGQSVADISPNSAITWFQSAVRGLVRLKLISTLDPSAPGGYKNLSVTVAPPALLFDVDIKLATGIYFVSINALYSQVQASA